MNENHQKQLKRFEKQLREGITNTPGSETLKKVERSYGRPDYENAFKELVCIIRDTSELGPIWDTLEEICVENNIEY